jgi:hypothetical protein
MIFPSHIGTSYVCDKPECYSSRAYGTHSLEPIKQNKKFCEELNAYFLLLLHGPHRKRKNEGETYRHREQGDLISPLLAFQNKEIRLKILYAFLCSLMCATCPAPLILLVLIIPITFVLFDKYN